MTHNQNEEQRSSINRTEVVNYIFCTDNDSSNSQSMHDSTLASNKPNTLNYNPAAFYAGHTYKPIETGM